RDLTVTGVQTCALPIYELTKRQLALIALLREKKSVLLASFLKEAGTSSATLKKLEEAHVISIAPEVSERDPYANEVILPSPALRSEERRVGKECRAQ